MRFHWKEIFRVISTLTNASDPNLDKIQKHDMWHVTALF